MCPGHNHESHIYRLFVSITLSLHIVFCIWNKINDNTKMLVHEQWGNTTTTTTRTIIALQIYFTDGISLVRYSIQAEKGHQILVVGIELYSLVWIWLGVTQWIYIEFWASERKSAHMIESIETIWQHLIFYRRPIVPYSFSFPARIPAFNGAACCYHTRQLYQRCQLKILFMETKRCAATNNEFVVRQGLIYLIKQ